MKFTTHLTASVLALLLIASLAGCDNDAEVVEPASTTPQQNQQDPDLLVVRGSPDGQSNQQQNNQQQSIPRTLELEDGQQGTQQSGNQSRNQNRDTDDTVSSDVLGISGKETDQPITTQRFNQGQQDGQQASSQQRQQQQRNQQQQQQDGQQASSQGNQQQQQSGQQASSQQQQQRNQQQQSARQGQNQTGSGILGISGRSSDQEVTTQRFNNEQNQQGQQGQQASSQQQNQQQQQESQQQSEGSANQQNSQQREATAQNQQKSQQQQQKQQRSRGETEPPTVAQNQGPVETKAVTLGQPFTIDGVQMTLSDPQIRKVTAIRNGQETQSEQEHLVLKVSMKNTTDSDNIVLFDPWDRTDARDQNNKRYLSSFKFATINTTFKEQLDGMVQLEPGEEVQDTMILQAPLPGADEITISGDPGFRWTTEDGVLRDISANKFKLTLGSDLIANAQEG